MATRKRLVTALNPAHPAWKEARDNIDNAYLPFACRELLSGDADAVVMAEADYLKLLTALSRTAALRGVPANLLDAVEPPAAAAQVPSERELAAGKLAELITQAGAAGLYGGDVLRHRTGRYYAVAFAKGAALSGQVQLFSPEFVRVVYTSVIAALGATGSRVFASVSDAARFLALALHAGDYAGALAVPLRPRRPKDGAA